MGLAHHLAVAALVATGVTTAPTASPAAPHPAAAAQGSPAAQAGALPGSPGSPGSIVFLKDYNIWLVNPDDSGLFQVTKDGTYASPYHSPSMADDGTIAAGKNQFIVRMRQNGTVLTSMDPPPLVNSAGQPQDGVPVDVAISPDGSKIAWTTASYTCPIGTECGARAVTGVTSAAGLTPPTTTSYYGDPSWVTASRLMVHGGYLSQVMLQDLGGAAQHWFDDSDYAPSSTDLKDGSLSRDGRFLVAVRGYAEGSHLITFTVTGNPLTGVPTTVPTPAPACVTNTDAELASPSVAPDASAFAFQDADGVGVMRLAPTCDAYVATTIVPGGERPFWSPAANNPGAVVGDQPPSRTFDLVTKPGSSGRAEVGAKLRVTAGAWRPTPERVLFQWLRGGKPIRGATKATYRVKRADRGKRLSVRVTASATGVAPQSVTVRVGRVKKR